MALILAANLMSGSHALSLWWTGRDVSAADGLLLAGELLFGAFATFVSTMLLVKGRLSSVAFLRFLGAAVVGLLPILLPLALLLFAINAENRGSLVMVLLLIMLAGIPIAALLSAWPVAQALTQTFVSPMRIISGTNGHRWMLIGANFAIGSLNKVAPDVDTAKVAWEALLIIAVQVAVGCGSMMLLVAVMVSAWRSNRSLGPMSGSGQPAN